MKDFVVESIEDPHHHLLEEMLELEWESFGEGGVDRWTMPYLVRHGKVFVILKENTVVGLAEIMRDFEEGNHVYLVGMLVRKEYRGQGVAAKLLRDLLDHLGSRGFKKLSLTVSPQNKTALSLYRDKFGFREVSYEQQEYGVGEDRIRMELVIV